MIDILRSQKKNLLLRPFIKLHGVGQEVVLLGLYKIWGVGIQFIDTQTGKVNWEGYDEIDITYAIERKYVTFNSNALYLGGAPWVIKSYTKKHIILMQNEASPDKEKIATIELDRID